MDKAVPVWILLLFLLLGALFTMTFGWSIQSTLSGSDRSGLFGHAALTVATFPTLARSIVTELLVDGHEQVHVPSITVDLSKFSKIKQKTGLDLEGHSIRADREALLRASGWRILIRAFSIAAETKNAAIVLSPGQRGRVRGPTML